MSVSAEAFDGVRRVALSTEPTTGLRAQRTFTPGRQATDYGNQYRGVDRRVYLAIACSVLLHVWLLWRADAGNVGHATEAQTSPLAIRIKTVVAPLAPGQTTQVKPAQARREPLAHKAPPVRPKPRHIEQPVQPPARAEPAPTVSVQSPATRDLATAPAATQPAAPVTTAKAQTTSAAMGAELPLITDPRYRSRPQPPEYPPQSVRRNEEGTALIRARISPRGEVIEARLFESSGSARLDKSALAAVQRWLFVPALRDGQPSEAWVQVPVQFRLDE